MSEFLSAYFLVSLVCLFSFLVGVGAGLGLGAALWRRSRGEDR